MRLPELKYVSCVRVSLCFYRVDILDFNERGPVFSQNIYNGLIDENLSVGANVVTV